MKKWRPKSWSQQARERADKRFKNSDDLSITFSLLSLDYEKTHSLRELRVIKRFGRLRRKNNMTIQYLTPEAFWDRVMEMETE